MAFLLCIKNHVEKMDKRVLKTFRNALLLMIAVFSVLVGSIYASGRDLAIIREDYIFLEKERHSTQIEIFEIPYPYFFSGGDWAFGKYYYYDQPGDIQFSIIDHYLWLGHNYGELQ